MAYANRKSISIFASLVVCLFVLQAVAFFYHGALHNAQPRSVADAAVSLTTTSDAAVLCEKPADHAQPDHGDCNHIGFCVLCSAEGRMAAGFVLPPLRADYIVVLRDAHEAPSTPASEPDVIPPPTTGWIVSWSATSPPRG